MCSSTAISDFSSRGMDGKDGYDFGISMDREMDTDILACFSPVQERDKF